MVFSTPQHKRSTIIPCAPNKDYKRFRLDHLLENTPTKISTSNKFIIGKSHNVQTQYLIPLDNTTVNNIFKKRKLMDDDDGILGTKLNLDDWDEGWNSPISDLESISPLSDAQSPLTPSDITPNEVISMKKINHVNLQDETFKLNVKIQNTLFESPSNSLEDTVKNNGSDFSHGKGDATEIITIANSGSNNLTFSKLRRPSIDFGPTRFTPKHRLLKPKKTILNVHPGSLNLIVGSGNGSLDDATIYATEINSSNDDNKIPYISNIWERVTIPVNNTIKQRHKRMRSSYYGEFYDINNNDNIENTKSNTSSSEENNKANDDKDDVALIRAFEFNDLKQKESHIKKSIKWSI